MFALLGFGMVIAACILVKRFDEWVRKEKYRKACVNVLMICGLLLTIVGMVDIFI